MLQMKKSMVAFLLVALSCIATMFGGCSAPTTGNTQEKIGEFYATVSRSQECLDEVADDIYDYWYRAIYKDAYNGNVSLAVWAAQDANSENLKIIEDNDILIQSLYKEIRDSELSDEIKDVMSAYNEYYEFIVNVSGSYSSFSASKETLKKALAKALKNLEMEI